jgi:hypothetical protein
MGITFGVILGAVALVALVALTVNYFRPQSSGEPPALRAYEADVEAGTPNSAQRRQFGSLSDIKLFVPGLREKEEERRRLEEEERRREEEADAEFESAGSPVTRQAPMRMLTRVLTRAFTSRRPRRKTTKKAPPMPSMDASSAPPMPSKVTPALQLAIPGSSPAPLSPVSPGDEIVLVARRSSYDDNGGVVSLEPASPDSAEHSPFIGDDEEEPLTSRPSDNTPVANRIASPVSRKSLAQAPQEALSTSDNSRLSSDAAASELRGFAGMLRKTTTLRRKSAASPTSTAVSPSSELGTLSPTAVQAYAELFAGMSAKPETLSIPHSEGTVQRMASTRSWNSPTSAYPETPAIPSVPRLGRDGENSSMPSSP